jgi:ubiquinone/menaquinone biosynthesis C-methylase UbiE
MTNRTISSEFRDVDKAEKSDELVRYLEYVDSLQETREMKEHSYKYLGLTEGSVVLDAGCGPGYDVLRMAARVGRSGHVTGIDLSERMIAIAQEKAAASGLPVSFGTGNVCMLDLPDAGYDAVREERTLQIIENPGQALDELVRVLRPGGRLVAVEPDWETFVIDPGNRDCTRKFFRFCADQFPDGSTGRKLFRYFRERNLHDVVVHPEPLVLHDFSLACQVTNMTRFLAAAVEQNVLSLREADEWQQEMRSADADGNFTFSGMIFCVAGRK